MADLDAQVRAADPDRWLSSRLVSDPVARADLVAFYAFEAELRAIRTRVSQPLLAEMRLTWWSEQVGCLFAGVPSRGHPVLEELAPAIARGRLERAPLDALIEAHIGRAHGQPDDLNALFVGPMQIGVRILAGSEYDAEVVEPGLLWGLKQTGRFADAAAMMAPANAAIRGLPPQAFPAAAHAVLRPGSTNEGRKRLRLLWASVTGRL